jgi:hypothetical protein
MNCSICVVANTDQVQEQCFYGYRLSFRRRRLLNFFIPFFNGLGCAITLDFTQLYHRLKTVLFKLRSRFIRWCWRIKVLLQGGIDIESCQARTLSLLAKAYGSITPEKAAEYLGLSGDVIVPGILTFFALVLMKPCKLRNGLIMRRRICWFRRRWHNVILLFTLLMLARREIQSEAEFADFARLTEIAMMLKRRWDLELVDWHS